MSFIKTEIHSKNIAVLKLDDPDARNAMSIEMAEDLMRAISTIESNDDIRCVVLTGEGSSFCSGGKLESKHGESAIQKPAHIDMRAVYNPLVLMLKSLRVPLISAINGPAVGIGVTFALISDLTYASKKAHFHMAFSKVGLVPDGGATWLLPRMIGTKKAAELAMLGDRLSAEDALVWGLINNVFDGDELLDKSLEVAGKLADGPMSLSLIRKALWSSWQNSFEQQLEVEADLQTTAKDSADFMEGARAFLEKRKPKFSGK